jgi:Zn-dependent protease with chaperone function
MWLFALAVVCIVILVNLLLVGILFNLDSPSSGYGDEQSGFNHFIQFVSQVPPEVWLITTLAILIVTGCASLYKHSQISRGGGSLIAEQLDGRLLTPGSSDFYERRLLNIVEEMAIASGMPVPPVYVLDEEQGINAFAVGH